MFLLKNVKNLKMFARFCLFCQKSQNVFIRKCQKSQNVVAICKFQNYFYLCPKIYLTNYAERHFSRFISITRG